MLRTAFSSKLVKFEFSLQPTRRAFLFLLVIIVPSLLVAAKNLQVAIASMLSESSIPSDLQEASLLDPENPELHYRLGRSYSYSAEAVDSAKALKHLHRATELNPFKPFYWVELATACETAGNLTCADQGFEHALALGPMLPRLYWLNANYYLRTGRPQTAFPRLQRLLQMSPEYSRPAFDLCLRVLDDPETVFQRVLLPGNDPRLNLAFADFLTARGNEDYAIQVWARNLANSPSIPFSSVKPLLDGLLDHHRYLEANTVWKDMNRLGVIRPTAGASRDNLVFNGSFEQPPLNTGFDWRYGEVPYLSIDFLGSAAYDGSRCLRLNFSVSSNEDTEPVYEIVPVVPGQKYHLSAYTRSEDITSDSGPRLRVVDLECPSCLDLSSEATVGTTAWHQVRLEFQGGARTRFLRLSIWRPRSRAFPAEITGRYWVDAIVMKPGEGESGQPAVAAESTKHRSSPAS